MICQKCNTATLKISKYIIYFGTVIGNEAKGYVLTTKYAIDPNPLEVLICDRCVSGYKRYQLILYSIGLLLMILGMYCVFCYLDRLAAWSQSMTSNFIIIFGFGGVFTLAFLLITVFSSKTRSGDNLAVRISRSKYKINRYQRLFTRESYKKLKKLTC